MVSSGGNLIQISIWIRLPFEDFIRVKQAVEVLIVCFYCNCVWIFILVNCWNIMIFMRKYEPALAKLCLHKIVILFPCKGGLWLVETLLYKLRKKFSEHNAKNFAKNSLRLPRNPKKKTKWFHSIMTSLTMFTPNKNLFNLAVSRSPSKYPYQSV